MDFARDIRDTERGGKAHILVVGKPRAAFYY